MGLAKRIIPCLDVGNGRVLKGIHFKDMRDAGDPVELAKRYMEDSADELVFLDITASAEKRKTISKLVRNVASTLDIPFTVGGGIGSVEDARVVLTNGADKVSVNTAAVENPSFVKALSNRFGQQCVVVAIDAKRRGSGKNLWFEVYTYGGRKPTGLDVLKWAQMVERLGAGELLVTSIDRDGMQNGYDLELTRAVSELVKIPVIASGGCGEASHFLEAFKVGKADAALAASIFHFQTHPIRKVKKYLKENGVEVRI